MPTGTQSLNAAPNFPTAIAAFASAAVFLMLGFASFLTWKVEEQIRTVVKAQAEVLTGVERLEHYGSVLELSIKAVVATGDLEAAARYRAVQPQLRETLRDLRANLQSSANRMAAAEVNRVDVALTVREYQALDLASRGKLAAARLLIHNEEYSHNLKMYYDSVAEIKRRATEHFLESEGRLESYLTNIFLLSLTSFVVIVLGVIAVGRPTHRWALRLRRAQKTAGRALSNLAEAQESLRQANKTLFDQARMDPLTGLQSRRKFNEDIEEVLPRALQGSESYSLIMCDVDHFKLYNDTYGHLAGDEVLRSVAEAFKSVTRAKDKIYRYGGEEFVLLLHTSSLEAGKVSAERYRAAIEAMSIPHCRNERGIVTISMGLAQIEPGLGISIGRWIELADKALYDAKRGGRNRVASGIALAA